MSEYNATVQWARNGAVFSDNRYSRGHQWRFDGGIEVPASASPHIVPLPHSVEEAVDPEEAFVASLSSCHMLMFLAIAAKKRLVVDSYRDEAVGVLEKNEDGRLAMTRVTLRPEVRFADEAPSRDKVLKMHHQAHAQCFIASSVTTDVQCEPAEDAAGACTSSTMSSRGRST